MIIRFKKIHGQHKSATQSWSRPGNYLLLFTSYLAFSLSLSLSLSLSPSLIHSFIYCCHFMPFSHVPSFSRDDSLYHISLTLPLPSHRLLLVIQACNPLLSHLMIFYFFSRIPLRFLRGLLIVTRWESCTGSHWYFPYCLPVWLAVWLAGFKSLRSSSHIFRLSTFSLSLIQF